MKMEMKLNKLLAKLEKRWFAEGEQKQYNDDMRKLLVNDEWVQDEDIDDIIWFFENLLVGNDFYKQGIINDFKENCNDDNESYINFMSNFESIMVHVDGLAISGGYE